MNTTTTLAKEGAVLSSMAIRSLRIVLPWNSLALLKLMVVRGIQLV